MEQILGTKSIELHVYTLEQFVVEVGLECLWLIVQRVIGTMKTAKDRMNWVTVIVEKYPHPEN